MSSAAFWVFLAGTTWAATLPHPLHQALASLTFFGVALALLWFARKEKV